MNVDDASTPRVSLVALPAPSRTGTATGTAERHQKVCPGCTAWNNASVTTTIGSAAQSVSTMSVEGVFAPATASGSGEITAGDTPLDEARADYSTKSKSKREIEAGKCPDQTMQLCSNSIHNHVPGHLSAVKFLCNNPSNECNSLLVDFCDSLTKRAGEIFPKRASKLTSSELTFLTLVGALKKPLVEQLSLFCLVPSVG